MDKVPILTNFPLEPGCGLLTGSTDTPELDASFDEIDAMPSSVSSGFLYMVSIICHTLRLQLAPSIESCKLLCQARILLLLMSQAGEMEASKLICYFSVIQLHLDSGLLHHLIISP